MALGEKEKEGRIFINEPIHHWSNGYLSHIIYGGFG